MSHDWYWSSEYKGNKGIRRKIVFTVENNKIWRGEWLNAGKRRQQKNYVNYAKEGNETHEEKVFFPWFRHDIHSLLTVTWKNRRKHLFFGNWNELFLHNFVIFPSWLGFVKNYNLDSLILAGKLGYLLNKERDSLESLSMMH